MNFYEMNELLILKLEHKYEQQKTVQNYKKIL